MTVEETADTIYPGLPSTPMAGREGAALTVYCGPVLIIARETPRIEKVARAIADDFGEG